MFMGHKATDDKIVEVLDPTGEVNVSSESIAPRTDGLEGKTVGLLDNSKSNANVLLDEVANILIEKYGVEETIYKRKDKSPIPADDLANQLHSQCDAVVNAYGDCGSCTSWCVYDSIDLEKEGTPVATINTDEFVKLGQSEAQSLEMPGLPIVTVPHPMGDIAETEVRKRASDVVPQVVDVLTRDCERLEEEYENKYLDTDEELTDEDLYCPI